jgi:ribosomal protein S18 acetylase RimI-like enzyme
LSFAILDAVAPERVDELVALYAHGWWTTGRTRADVERMLAGTDELFVPIDVETGRLAGFTRALSDGVYRAFVYDVIVLPEYRGRRLGEMLMDAVLERLGHLERIELACQDDLIAFYARHGFTNEVAGSNLMRRSA